jgi:predicted glycosyltransferase
MYSQDGWGLGHLRRSLNIAGEVRLENPECEVVILADSPAVSITGTRPGIELVKLPTIIKTGSNRWQNATLSMPVRSVIELRSQLMLQAMIGFQPDAVLIDHMPVGALGELKPLLDHAARRRGRTKLFLGLRDIIDRPTVVRRAWSDLGAYDYVSVYDAVLVYGSRSVYDASAAYGLGPFAREVDYCGYVSPRAAGTAPAPSGAAPYVLMLGGGGGDAFPLASAFVEALATLNGELGMDAVMLTGPNMAAADRQNLLSRATSKVHVAGAYDDATKWIRGASAVVTMAGYNSLCEVLRWRKKALVVPRSGPSAEQQIRSSLFSRRNLIRLLAPEALTPHRLAAELTQLLADETVPDAAGMPALDGAPRTARTLLDLGMPLRRRVNGSGASHEEAAGGSRVPAGSRTGIEVSPV